MRIVASGVNQWMGPGNALILITHYQRLLDYIHPNFVHVVIDGKDCAVGRCRIGARARVKRVRLAPYRGIMSQLIGHLEALFSQLEN